MLEVFIILIGLCVASFLGSLSYRVPRHISMIEPPSSCPSCGRRLKVYELIPVIGYAVVGGRCRHCHSRIGVQYFIVELLTPFIYFVLYRIYGITPLFFCYGYLASLLLYLSLVDLDTGSVSLYDTAAVYAGSFVTLLFRMGAEGRRALLSSVYGCALAGGLLLLSVLIVYLLRKKQPLGRGDMMIIPGVALYFAVQEVIRILILSSLIGLAAGLLLIMTGRVKWDFRFPMLPFITAGVFVEFFILLLYY